MGEYFRGGESYLPIIAGSGTTLIGNESGANSTIFSPFKKNAEL